MSETIFSFEDCYKTYSKLVYNTALGYLQNIEDAEEVTQDVFMEIYRSINNFKSVSSLKTWIYRIAINKSLDFIKHKKRKKRFGLMTSLFSGDSLQPSVEIIDFYHPGVVFENKEKAAILFKAIATLPETQKTVFLLSKMESLSNIEISEITNKSIPAIESLLSRAKENLKLKLQDYYKV